MNTEAPGYILQLSPFSHGFLLEILSLHFELFFNIFFQVLIRITDVFYFNSFIDIFSLKSQFRDFFFSFRKLSQLSICKNSYCLDSSLYLLPLVVNSRFIREGPFPP